MNTVYGSRNARDVRFIACGKMVSLTVVKSGFWGLEKEEIKRFAILLQT